MCAGLLQPRTLEVVAQRTGRRKETCIKTMKITRSKMNNTETMGTYDM